MKRQLKQNAIKCFKWEQRKKRPEARKRLRRDDILLGIPMAVNQKRIDFSGSKTKNRLIHVESKWGFIQQYVIEVDSKE